MKLMEDRKGEERRQEEMGFRVVYGVLRKYCLFAFHDFHRVFSM